MSDKRYRGTIHFTDEDEFNAEKQKAKNMKLSFSNYVRSKLGLEPMAKGGYRGYPPPKNQNAKIKVSKTGKISNKSKKLLKENE